MIDLKGIDMVSELERLGIKFKTAGSKSYAAVCPLHADKDPSFHVYKDSQKDKFKCFGCGKHGDILDFLMAYHGCDWKTAAAKVGVEPEKQDKHRIAFRQHQDALGKEYESWKMEMLSGLGHLLELAHDAMVDSFLPDNLHEAGDILAIIEKWSLWKEILLSGDEWEILKIYKREKNKLEPVTDFARQDFERRVHGS